MRERERERKREREREMRLRPLSRFAWVSGPLEGPLFKDPMSVLGLVSNQVPI